MTVRLQFVDRKIKLYVNHRHTSFLIIQPNKKNFQKNITTAK